MSLLLFCCVDLFPLPLPLCLVIHFSFFLPLEIVPKRDWNTTRSTSTTTTVIQYTRSQLSIVKLSLSPPCQCFLFSSCLYSSVSSRSVCLRTRSRRTPFSLMLPVFTRPQQSKVQGSRTFSLLEPAVTSFTFQPHAHWRLYCVHIECWWQCKGTVA